jgi:hypothetical protein
VAGLEIILEAAAVEINSTRGGKNPCDVEETSNLADEEGVLVPIPTCENNTPQFSKHENGNDKNF